MIKPVGKRDLRITLLARVPAFSDVGPTTRPGHTLSPRKRATNGVRGREDLARRADGLDAAAVHHHYLSASANASAWSWVT